MPDFKLVSDFQPTGDQPQAIDALVDGLQRGYKAYGEGGTLKPAAFADVAIVLRRYLLVFKCNFQFVEYFP